MGVGAAEVGHPVVGAVLQLISEDPQTKTKATGEDRREGVWHEQR